MFLFIGYILTHLFPTHPFTTPKVALETNRLDLWFFFFFKKKRVLFRKCAWTMNRKWKYKMLVILFCWFNTGAYLDPSETIIPDRTFCENTSWMEAPSRLGNNVSPECTVSEVAISRKYKNISARKPNLMLNKV